MENGQQEIIPLETIHDKAYPMRQFDFFCKRDILFCCHNCNTILTTNSIIEKILRLTTGKICFIMGDEGENSELMKEFQSKLVIHPELKVNNITDFKTVGLNEVSCKNCNEPLGVKIRQADETQIFMLEKIILKTDAVKCFIIEEGGLRYLNIIYKTETIKNMDKLANETEEYIQKSGHQIQKFFDILCSQNNDFQEMKIRKENIDKLGDILKYLIDKNYI